jgi:putative transcriptional regulator
MEEVARDDHGRGLGRREQLAETFEHVRTVPDRELEPAARALPEVQVRDDEDVPDHEGAVTEGQVRRRFHVDRSAPDGQMTLERVFATSASSRPMVDLLESKRDATRFRVLVEIADRQPAVSQEEIADAVGVTSQAVSEYIRELVEEGLVDKEGRSRYRVTQEGVDWLFSAAGGVQRFLDHVTEDVLGGVQEDAAIAEEAIAEGETVTLSMRDGLMHARPGSGGAATGIATTDAAAGAVVGVTGFEGVIDFDPGQVTVLTIPPVRSNESPDFDTLAGTCGDADVVCAAGVEAVVALEAAGVEVSTWLAPGEVAGDAATRGLDAVVVTTTDTLGRVTDALRGEGIAYEVTE